MYGPENTRKYRGKGASCIAVGRREVDAKASEAELYIWWIVNSTTQYLKPSTFTVMPEVKSYAERREWQILLRSGQMFESRKACEVVVEDSSKEVLPGWVENPIYSWFNLETMNI